jgi:LuxR family maltose regulon positive regulatory protein
MRSSSRPTRTAAGTATIRCSPSCSGGGELVEPLSDRERTVLRYLPSRLSAAEIADELYLSVHTVKSHQRNLYRKLQATSRREAVDRARGLSLL